MSPLSERPKVASTCSGDVWIFAQSCGVATQHGTLLAARRALHLGKQRTIHRSSSQLRSPLQENADGSVDIGELHLLLPAARWQRPHHLVQAHAAESVATPSHSAHRLILTVHLAHLMYLRVSQWWVGGNIMSCTVPHPKIRGMMAWLWS